MAYENNDKRMESVYSKRIRAGKRRTYFFDVRATRGNDYYLTITESRKKFNEDGYDRHKIFLYKEDFNKFIKALIEAVDYVKTDLMPDFDFDAFNHDQVFEGGEGHQEQGTYEHVSNGQQAVNGDFSVNGENSLNGEMVSNEVHAEKEFEPQLVSAATATVIDVLESEALTVERPVTEVTAETASSSTDHLEEVDKW